MEQKADGSQSWRSASTDTPFPIWRPASFKQPFLICMSVATSLLLGVTIILHLIDSQRGMLFVAAAGKELSVFDLFLIRYLPTILLVTYGSWISTLDLDIKRLEPWVWLSSSPATSKESPLLCRYDTNFVGTVLVESIKKRHWIVFNSSIFALVATVVVPAVLSSMFSIRREDIHRPLPISIAAGLVDVDVQKFRMTSNLLLSAYSTAWLGQTAPAFSTNSYVLSPFSVPGVSMDTVNAALSNTTVRGSTRRYWSELNCWPPASVTLNFSSSTVSFNDGRGCEAKDLLSFNSTVTDLNDQNARYEAYQYGIGSFGGNPYLPNLFMECPERPHLTLATWREAGSSTPNFAPGGNATAMFCESAYFSEPVDATIKMPEFSVVSYTATGPKVEVPDDSFNKTHFEYIISSGSPPLDTTYDNLTAIVDIADSMYVEQSNRILNMSVFAPIQQSKDVMIGFALGATQFAPETYLNMDTLYTAYTMAHQLLFVHALQHIFDENTSISNLAGVNDTTLISDSQTGVLITQQETARLVNGFTIATETTLVLLCALSIYLLVMLPRRRLALCQNPDSLAATMMLSRSLETQSWFARMTMASDKLLQDKLHGLRFHVDYDDKGPLLVADHSEQIGTDDEQISTALEPSTLPAQHTKHTLELSWTVAGFVCCLLLGSAAFLIALNIMVWSRNGLVMFPSSLFVQQLVLSFLPTAAATLLGIYLVLLCRIYSFMKPMQDLYHGNATAKTTLLVNYNSTPPQLLFGRALKSRHYLLAALSIAALLSNVLTVTTASMFTMQQTEIDSSIQLFSDFDPVVIDHTSPSVAALGDVIGSSPLDPVYPNAVNMSDGVPLPSWTSLEYGFIPVNLEPAAPMKASSYGLELPGYGADLDCSDLLESNPEYRGSIEFQNNGTTFKVWANFSQPDGAPTMCVFDLEYENDLARLNLAKLSSTVSALEISNYMSLWNGTVPLQDGFCASRIIKGWLRARATTAPPADSFSMDYNATILVCQPRLKTQRLSLNVSANGEVLSSQATAPATYDLPPSVNLSSTFRIAINAMRDFMDLPQWHNDTIARDWSNYLFLEFNGNRDWLNASMPVPTVEVASAVVSAIFSRIFAVQLSIDRVKLQLADSANSFSTLQARIDDQNTTTMTNGIPVKAIILITKLFISRPNFIVSLAIIIFDLIVLVTFRVTLPKPFLPRMPFTIASQIAFFSGSHVIDDVVKAGGNLKELDEKGYRYAYGKYIGKDGWLHEGIEREQFVTKL